VSASNVRNRKVGLFLYGITGRASNPFTGRVLCVRTPIKRTTMVQSGGTPLPVNDCTGVDAIDMTAFAAGLLGGTPLFELQVPGTAVNGQFWGRDPGIPAPNATTLSDAVEYFVRL
jgi:hypothetical protein